MEITIKSKTYQSIRECCKQLDINYRVVTGMKHFYKDRTYEDIVTSLIDKNTSRNNPIIKDGVQYDSIIDYCRKNNLKSHRIYGLLRLGYSLDEATDLANNIQAKDRVSVTVRGVTYDTLKDCCTDLGISYDSVISYRYYHKDVSYADIIEQKLNSDEPRDTTVTVNGVTYNSTEECCTALNINYDDIILAKQKFSRYPIGKIISNKMYLESYKEPYHKRKINSDTDVISRAKPITFDGVEYKSVRECCLAVGIDYDKVINRKTIYKGKTYEEIIREYLEGVCTTRIVVNGKVYNSMSQYCKSEGIDASLFSYLKNKHKDKSLEDITEMIKTDAYGTLVVINGVKYHSVMKCCRELGVDYRSVKAYKHNHPDVDYDIIVNIYLEKKKAKDNKNNTDTQEN